MMKIRKLYELENLNMNFWMKRIMAVRRNFIIGIGKRR